MNKAAIVNKFSVRLHGEKYNLYLVDTPCILIIAKLSIREPGSSSV